MARLSILQQKHQETPESHGNPCPPLFEGDYWIEEACRLFAVRQRRKVTLGDDASALQMCHALLRTLRLHPSAHAFNQPVDPVALAIPDYLDVIDKPMDLGTVDAYLRLDHYSQEHMLSDVLLVFENARSTSTKHPVHVAALTLRGVYDRELTGMRAKWLTNGEEQSCREGTSANQLYVISSP